MSYVTIINQMCLPVDVGVPQGYDIYWPPAI